MHCDLLVYSDYIRRHRKTHHEEGLLSPPLKRIGTSKRQEQKKRQALRYIETHEVSHNQPKTLDDLLIVEQALLQRLGQYTKPAPCPEVKTLVAMKESEIPYKKRKRFLFVK